jgi:hypothetical protein
VPDGFEYQSALDLNSVALPFPDKRPVPEPARQGGRGPDFDGDGMRLVEEFRAWNVTGRPVPAELLGRHAAHGRHRPERRRKDADADGLSNFDELSGP